MKSVQIAIKNLKELIRNFKSNAIIFILPFAFMGIFALAFGKSGAESTFKIGVAESSSPMYAPLVQTLEKLETPKGKKLFEITKYKEESEVTQKVEDSELLAMVNLTQDNKLNVKGNITNPEFNVVTGILTRVSNEFFGASTQSNLNVESIVQTQEDFSPFQLMAPGLMIYGILMMIPQVATNMAMMSEKKQLFRYFTSKATAADILGGYLISQTVIGLIQTAILFFTAIMFGMDAKGGLLTAMLISIPANFFAIGVGLLIGTLTRKSDNAGNIGSLVSVILGFMSGSFLVSSNGNTLFKEMLGFDIFPSAYASRAMSSVLLFGRSLSEITSELTVLVLSSLAVLVVGMILFNWRQLREIG